MLLLLLCAVVVVVLRVFVLLLLCCVVCFCVLLCVVVVSVVELHATFHCIKVVSAAQQRFYCKLMLPTTIQIKRDSL